MRLVSPLHRAAALAALSASLLVCSSGGGSPSPPSPPPAAKEVPVQNEDKALTLYRDYLTQLGRETDGITERTEWKGSWRYFYREAGRIQKADEIALGPAGQIVSRDDKDHWHPFLSQPDLDAAQLAERVVWLTSRMGQAIGPTFRLKSKKAQQLVNKPQLDRAPDGTLKFTFWAIHPPAMDSPYRVTITAPSAGPAQFETIGWEDLSTKK